MEQKPRSLSLKDFLINRLSVEENIPLLWVQRTVEHQALHLIQQMKTCSSVELSGMGRLVYNRKKALRLKQKCLSQIELFSGKLALSPSSVSLQKKLQGAEQTLQYISAHEAA